MDRPSARRVRPVCPPSPRPTPCVLVCPRTGAVLWELPAGSYPPAPIVREGFVRAWEERSRRGRCCGARDAGHCPGPEIAVAYRGGPVWRQLTVATPAPCDPGTGAASWLDGGLLLLVLAVAVGALALLLLPAPPVWAWAAWAAGCLLFLAAYAVTRPGGLA